jgi:penicillin-binding protein 1A
VNKNQIKFKQNSYNTLTETTADLNQKNLKSKTSDDHPFKISHFSLKKELKKILKNCFMMISLGLFFSGIVFLIFWKHYAPGLETIEFLKTYVPPTVSRFYTDDGTLFTEHALENRIFVPLTCIPQKIIHAFLAAEDKGFYHHWGCDPAGIFRAFVKNWISNSRPSGASTITQQVAKNLILKDRSVTLNRKIKELFTAFQIERLLTKDRILELYLNEIYLGRRTYGIGSATLSYFNKNLEDISLEEAAFLAALPQAPSILDPLKHPSRCLERRNWVLKRMYLLGFITSEAYQTAQKKPLSSFPGRYKIKTHEADYFDAYVKQTIAKMKGIKSLYTEGFNVHTTLRPCLQSEAKYALREACEAFDRRQGFRGASFHNNETNESVWKMHLKKLPRPQDTPLSWIWARVTHVNAHQFKIYTQDDKIGHVTLKTSLWARVLNIDGTSGALPKKCQDIVSVGDVVWVAPQLDETPSISSEAIPLQKTTLEDSKQIRVSQEYVLKQWPLINAAMVVMNPQNGHVMAMVGGYSFDKSQFNRAVQAHRSFGSLVKSFIYILAADRGWNPDDTISDEPFSWKWDADQPAYEPLNFDKKFNGDITFRVALISSRNIPIMTLVRDTIKLKPLHRFLKKLELNAPGTPFRCLPSIALGAFETTVLRAATAYCSLANGGYKINPVVIRRIQSPKGDLLWKPPVLYRTSLKTEENVPPMMYDLRSKIFKESSAYQINHMLSYGVKHGGNCRILNGIMPDLAAKTGTSSKNRDCWSVAYTPHMVVVVYMGYDDCRSLNEFGIKAALPMITTFLKRIKTNSKQISLYGGEFHPPKDIVWCPTKILQSNHLRVYHPDFEPIQESELVNDEE